MTKAIIFDLYDTILKDASFDFENGILYLYNTYFNQKCSFKEFKDYTESFKSLYDKRSIDNTEVCLIKDEIIPIFKKFDVSLPEDINSIDYTVMKHMQEVVLKDEVEFTINELNKLNIDMYILSNSIFTGESNRKLLNDFGISHYFKSVYSSADYKIRKPHPNFFDICVKSVLSGSSKINRDNIMYVGNDYETDIIGASSIALNTVWYNINHLPNIYQLKIADIDNFRDLLNII